MFIELTDHLRCPAEHAEQFLVLLPDLMKGRRVLRGELGCPVCGRVVRVTAGMADFGDSMASGGGTALSADAVAALLGLGGPGGYLALIGGVGSLAGELAALLPEIGLVLVNPPAAAAPESAAGILRAARLPLKSGSMRGVVLGADFARNPDWVRDGARAVLPGLRMVGEGGEPPVEGVELMGSSEGVWVVQRLSATSAKSRTPPPQYSPPSES